MSFGSMPAWRIVASSLPVVGPNSLSEPIPVSNSTSLLPVLRIRMFCSSTAFVSGRKFVVELRVHLGRGEAEEVGMGVAERQGAVRHHGGLGVAEVKR